MARRKPKITPISSREKLEGETSFSEIKHWLDIMWAEEKKEKAQKLKAKKLNHHRKKKSVMPDMREYLDAITTESR